MAHQPYRCHGNFPQRRATLFPQVSRCRVRWALEAESPETGSNGAARAEGPSLPEERLHSSGSCVMEKQSYGSTIRHSRAASPSSETRQPGKDVAALLERIRIHPDDRRILGNCSTPVVILERLNLQSVSCLQPVVSLVRLPRQTHANVTPDSSALPRHEPVKREREDLFLLNGVSENEAEVAEVSPQLHPDSTRTSWTEPYCPENSSSEEPEQDSGFDCESNPDQTYILCDSGSEEWDPDLKTDSETFYLDPDPEPTLVIELDPDPDQDESLELEDEPEAQCEVEIVQMEDSEVHCCSQEEADSSTQQPGPGSGPEEMESEDFCAVCLNGGDLLCCDRCPKVYHLGCHIPALRSFPLGDWVCSLCRGDQESVEIYDCEDTHSCGGVRAPYTLCDEDQRRCETLTLLLFCHTLSAPFHEPVSPLARNYYQIIKRPIDLSVIRRKLNKSNTLHYFTAEQFVDDVLLMFKNCATFNYPDSEVAQAGRHLELFFLDKLKEVFPDRMFLSACQDRTDRASLQWLKRKRRENCRKKRNTFNGKKYLL